MRHYDNDRVALKANPVYRRNYCPDIPSASLTPPAKPAQSTKPCERELAARKVAEARKKQVGILYNKGAYQYITDEELIKDLGR